MPWLALREEIAAELADLTPHPWHVVDMMRPERTEAERLEDARASLARRIRVLHAVGKVREARRLESYQRAGKRRRRGR